MHSKNSALGIRLYFIGAFILVAGWVGAAAVYLTATEDMSDAVGYEIVDGKVYKITPRDSKRYRHDLELYGGKAAVLADDFLQWFISLWHGRRLAYTMAWLATGGALVCFSAAHHLSNQPSRGQPEDQDR